MPYKPKRACAVPGCPNLTAGSRCDEHRRQVDLDYKHSRTDIDEQRFYQSALWRRVRRVKLAKDPLCELCLEAGLIHKTEIVHHIVPIKDGGAPLDLDNLRSACKSHHGQAEAQSRGGGGDKNLESQAFSVVAAVSSERPRNWVVG